MKLYQFAFDNIQEKQMEAANTLDMFQEISAVEL